MLPLFALPALGASLVGFSSGPFYSIVGTFASPTTPNVLRVLFDEPVPVDTFVPITTSDPTSLSVAGGGATLAAGQSSATVLVSAFNPSASVTLTASFNSIQAIAVVGVVSEIPNYTLTLATNGNGAIVTSPPGSSFPDATTVTLTATPATNYTFAGWSGGAAGTLNPLIVSMTNNLAITANFVFATNVVPISIALAAQIAWFAQANLHYQVQAADVLNSNSWFDLGALVAGNNQTNYFSDPLGANPRRFYRVQTRP
jgi:uncharacterized repeat protein (TIGR02543 family)